MKDSVLITDAKERSAVAACRSLHQSGYRVGTLSSERLAPAQWSRFVDARHRGPDPLHDGAAFARRVADVVAGGGYAALLPGSDAAVLALSEHRDLFGEDFRLGLPSPEVVERCVSKVDLMAAAGEAGLSVPETVLAADREQVPHAVERLGFPLVLKPRCTVFEHNGWIRQRASAMVWDRAMLEAGLADFGLPCLLQRRESAPVLSFAGVIADGRLLGVAFSRYTRTWRPDAGSVSFSQTEEPTPPLVDSVRLMLSSLGWEGIFELEAIETGPAKFAVIDFNPRLYGSLALAVGAGAPLPAVWCDWLLRGETADCSARPGFSYRWEDAELRNLFSYLRRGRIGEAIGLVRPRRQSTRAYFRWSDPGPLLARFVGVMLSKSTGKRQLGTRATQDLSEASG
jgi:predicted ATP-grasp superfamily ATP-dependent carboligase